MRRQQLVVLATLIIGCANELMKNRRDPGPIEHGIEALGKVPDDDIGIPLVTSVLKSLALILAEDSERDKRRSSKLQPRKVAEDCRQLAKELRERAESQLG